MRNPAAVPLRELAKSGKIFMRYRNPSDDQVGRAIKTAASKLRKQEKPLVNPATSSGAKDETDR